MKKLFNIVCAFLALAEGFDVKDGIVQITEAQMQQLEDHTHQLTDQVAQLTTDKKAAATQAAADQKTIADLTTEVAALKNQVETLKQQSPEDPDSPVPVQDGADPIDFHALAEAVDI